MGGSGQNAGLLGAIAKSNRYNSAWTIRRDILDEICPGNVPRDGVQGMYCVMSSARFRAKMARSRSCDVLISRFDLKFSAKFNIISF